MTDTADEAEYYRREQARFRFFRKIEERQSDSEKPADAPSTEARWIAADQQNAPVNSPATGNAR